MTVSGDYITTLLANGDPIIYNCPDNTIASTIEFTTGDMVGYNQLGEIEVHGQEVPETLVSEPVPLTNARFAFPYPGKPFDEGNSRGSWSDVWDVSKAIDRNFGRDGTAAHPANGATDADFFVNLTEPSVVDMVKVWPRIGDSRSDSMKYYEGRMVLAYNPDGVSVICPSERVYTEDYVKNTLIPNLEPTIFNCPANTLASVIRYTAGDFSPAYTQLAEIEVFTWRFLKILFIVNELHSF